ncbi:MAG: zf-HC2 domain-containing protein [Syntrophomonas sp.]|nr:zf-HC2 domain-containing protein [Syntrophomonas sp.]
MNCQDINQHMYDYCDGLVSPDLQSSMAEHLSKCESCRNNYQLTLIENETLCDAGDIPLLSEAFTARVMSSLVSADSFSSRPQPLVMSKNSSPYFKRISWYSSLAIVAAIITLCLYIPNLKDTGNKINVANNSFKQQQLELQSNAVKNNDYGTQITNEDTIKLSQVNPSPNADSVDQSKLPPSTLGSGSKSVPVHEDLTLAPSVLSAPVSTEAMKRSTNLEVGRSNRNESQVSDSAILAFSPQNIPDRFKLTKSNNTAENEAVYNYVSQDGKDNFQLKVTAYREKAMAIGPTSNITLQDSLPSLTKDIQVGDQKITLTVSGNIPTEELTRLVNTIQLADPSGMD